MQLYVLKLAYPNHGKSESSSDTDAAWYSNDTSPYGKCSIVIINKNRNLSQKIDSFFEP